MAIPDFQTLMLPVLRCAAKGDEVRTSDATRQIADELGVSKEERSELLPSGRQPRFANRVHWARAYLAMAGLVEPTRRGHYRITDRGKAVVAAPPERIDRKYLSRFPGFLERRSGQARAADVENGAADNDAQSPEERIRSAHVEAENALIHDLLERVRNGSPEFFEGLIVQLLTTMGYGGAQAASGRVLGRGGDNGVDGVIDQDALGLDRVYVQAKRYADGNPVGAGAIRDFFGSLDRHKAAKGVFVTTSQFTEAARETADLLSKRIVLIDGLQLARLMLHYDVGCRVVESFHLRAVDEDFFDV